MLKLFKNGIIFSAGITIAVYFCAIAEVAYEDFQKQTSHFTVL